MERRGEKGRVEERRVEERRSMKTLLHRGGVNMCKLVWSLMAARAGAVLVHFRQRLGGLGTASAAHAGG